MRREQGPATPGARTLAGAKPGVPSGEGAGAGVEVKVRVLVADTLTEEEPGAVGGAPSPAGVGARVPAGAGADIMDKICSSCPVSGTRWSTETKIRGEVGAEVEVGVRTMDPRTSAGAGAGAAHLSAGAGAGVRVKQGAGKCIMDKI